MENQVSINLNEYVGIHSWGHWSNLKNTNTFGFCSQCFCQPFSPSHYISFQFLFPLLKVFLWLFPSFASCFGSHIYSPTWQMIKLNSLRPTCFSLPLSYKTTSTNQLFQFPQVIFFFHSPGSTSTTKQQNDKATLYSLLK